MALTLDATLLAAQNATSRHPICELTVGKGVKDIPFPDNPGLAPQGIAQRYPSTVVLSTGEVVVFYAADGGSMTPNGGLWWVKSDAARTEYSTPTMLHSEYASTILGIDCIEMADGNIGVIVWYGSSWTCSLIAYKVSPAGVLLSTGTIWNYGGSAVIKSASITQGNVNCAVVYTKLDSSIGRRTSYDFVTWSAEELIFTAS